MDFRGPVHRSVLERMGLWEAIHERRTRLGTQALLDATGRTLVDLPALMMSGDVELQRGDLCQLLFERTRETVEYLFGDAPTALRETPSGVEVEFEQHAPRRFDLVVGADGLRSNVRSLLFGAAHDCLRHHGYRVVGCTLPNALGLRQRGVIYSEPGRGVSVTSAHDVEQVRALFVFTGAPLGPHERSPAAARDAVSAAFAGAGWKTRQLVEGLREAEDVYFDAVGSVRLARYSQGRVVLLGDAAWGGTLGGQGTPLAMVGAYVLAGELLASPEAHTDAFARFEARLRPYATPAQDGAKRVGGFFAPRTRPGLFLRNQFYRMLTSKPLERAFEKLVTHAANAFELPEYGGAFATPQGQ
ncbi:FAD-dependent monooxygenase [Myxococcus llanfairpwllgwyngyllgogerychwyrndrobwllllantysiliogogogochensis]|uniref:FAD-dependent monooxygenase n=1 Tax=Myxococcus llanfairpwllgwyngyllgogerychwyrndrobwllllantysiliogogogochensis TaxID=2590453 RepID=UPI001FE4AEB9|nr:FAD-dependent monooxygenase [Myxococcus llanfairpwllgwyngyllgogerychwyrndrobwllllantysiliogogogochensis]